MLMCLCVGWAPCTERNSMHKSLLNLRNSLHQVTFMLLCFFLWKYQITYFAIKLYVHEFFLWVHCLLNASRLCCSLCFLSASLPWLRLYKPKNLYMALGIFYVFVRLQLCWCLLSAQEQLQQQQQQQPKSQHQSSREKRKEKRRLRKTRTAFSANI